MSHPQEPPGAMRLCCLQTPSTSINIQLYFPIRLSLQALKEALSRLERYINEDCLQISWCVKQNSTRPTRPNLISLILLCMPECTIRQSWLLFFPLAHWLVLPTVQTSCNSILLVISDLTFINQPYCAAFTEARDQFECEFTEPFKAIFASLARQEQSSLTSASDMMSDSHGHDEHPAIPLIDSTSQDSHDPPTHSLQSHSPEKPKQNAGYEAFYLCPITLVSFTSYTAFNCQIRHNCIWNSAWQLTFDSITYLSIVSATEF